MYMKQILIFSMCLFSFAAFSQEVTMSAEVNRDSVLLGNHLIVTFSIENGKGDFEAPSFDNFMVISGPNMSTSTQIINGVYSGTQTISYYIKPEEIGDFIIPEAYYKMEDGNLSTLPIPFTVYPNPNGVIQEDAQIQNGMNFEFSFPPSGLFHEKSKKKKRKSTRKKV